MSAPDRIILDDNGRIPVSLLRDLISYSPETGCLTWKPRTPDLFRTSIKTPEQMCLAWNKRHAGKEALTASSHGYKIGTIFSKIYISHVVAWAISYGDWPSDQIDHIDGDQSNNRLSNLRHVDYSQNGKNTKLNASNKSGKMGVYQNKSNRKWVARIQTEGRRIHIGTYATKDEAISARNKAERKYGFHPNHGRLK